MSAMIAAVSLDSLMFRHESRPLNRRYLNPDATKVNPNANQTFVYVGIHSQKAIALDISKYFSISVLESTTVRLL